MTWSSRLLVLLAIAGVIGAPLLTLHPIATHLIEAGENGLPHELRDAAVIALFMLFGASLVPLAHLPRLGLAWARQATVLGSLRRESEPRTTGDGIVFWLFASPSVQFFTAGVVRPRIYASVGSLEQLEPAAFRAAILHEREHQRGHHVGWRLALATLETAFRPVAPVRRAVAALALECEFAADRAALAAGAERRHLFEAVVAAAGSSSPSVAASLTGAGTLQRLEALASSTEPANPSKLPLVWLVAGLSTLPLAAHGLLWVGAVCL
ncbi:MAG: hypothetical protein IH609_10510 [Dehalococcoidia bacterium]|nr:hypothetical protein [Dehalococcoidia bacterium]